MEIIDYDKKLSFEQITEVLSALFPGLIFFLNDECGMVVDPNFSYNRLDHVNITIDYYEAKHELRHIVRIDGCPEEGHMERAIHIAKALSIAYQTRTSVDFIPEGKTWESGVCLLFDNGKSFLADDYFTEPMSNNEPTKPIEIINAYEVPEYRFDAEGEWMGTTAG